MSLAAKLLSLAFLAVLIPVYWRHYGPSNFLWLSDLGLCCTVAAFVLGSPMLASMPAVGILVLELTWAAFAGAYVLTESAKNINWMFGWGPEPHTAMPAFAWFAIMCVGVPVLVVLPAHFLLSWGAAAGR